MTDDETQTLRAIIVAELAAAIEPLRSDIRELQADVALALDKLDRLEGIESTVLDVKAHTVKIDGIESTVLDLKAHNVKLSREGMKDRDARQNTERRLSAVERRLEALERKGDS